MRYLAVILMPTRKDKQSFKLKDLLTQTCEDIGKRKNSLGHILYQQVMSDSLISAQEAVQILNAPVELQNVPESPRMLYSTPLTHAILELTDDFDETKPLNEFVARVFMLQPEGYPHVELSRALDEVESRIRHLKKEIADSENADTLKELLNDAITDEGQLNARFDTLRAQPLEFRGPQFDRAQPPVVEPILVLNDILPSVADARDILGTDNNAGAITPPPSPRQIGLFAARVDGVADAELEEAPSSNICRHF